MKTKQTSGRKTLVGKTVKVTKPGSYEGDKGVVIKIYEDESPHNNKKRSMFVDMKIESGVVVKILKYRVTEEKPEVKPDKPKIKAKGQTKVKPGDTVRVTINSEISNTKAKVHSYIKDLNKYIVIPEKPYRRIDTLIVSPHHIKVDADDSKTLNKFLMDSLEVNDNSTPTPHQLSLPLESEKKEETVEQPAPPYLPLYLPFERVMLLDDSGNELGPGAIVSQVKNRYAATLDKDNSIHDLGPQNLRLL